LGWRFQRGGNIRNIIFDFADALQTVLQRISNFVNMHLCRLRCQTRRASQHFNKALDPTC